MNPRLQLIECDAQFADDTIWNEAETQIVQTEGQAMARTVAALLTANGAEVTEPVDHLEHGWELEVRWRSGRFFMQVSQLGNTAIIIMRDRTLGLLARLLRRSSPYPALLLMVHDAISSDDRFRNIRWHPFIIRQGVRGALSPTSPYPGPNE
jgi:hypothetical protein